MFPNLGRQSFSRIWLLLLHDCCLERKWNWRKRYVIGEEKAEPSAWWSLYSLLVMILIKSLTMDFYIVAPVLYLCWNRFVSVRPKKHELTMACANWSIQRYYWLVSEGYFIKNPAKVPNKFGSFFGFALCLKEYQFELVFWREGSG